MKQYLAIVRDHSMSMMTLAKAAMNDYNSNIEIIRKASEENDIETFVSTVMCGIGPGNGRVEVDFEKTYITDVPYMLSYITNGGSTPLFDSVGKCIDILEKSPNLKKPDVSAMVMVITDGEENSSTQWTGNALGGRIRELQATDKWSFIFRVPRGSKKRLTAIGIPEGNIIEWDQTEAGLAYSSAATQAAFGSYYNDRKTKGITSTRGFYVTDAANITSKDVKQNLRDISKEVKIWNVDHLDNDMAISRFCELKLKKPMTKGCAFYQLMKHERNVQEYKMICIQDKKSRAVYAGVAARDLLGLPQFGNISLSPGDHGNYEIYIQSTSLNRKVKQGTNVLYWSEAAR